VMHGAWRFLLFLPPCNIDRCHQASVSGLSYRTFNFLQFVSHLQVREGSEELGDLPRLEYMQLNYFVLHTARIVPPQDGLLGCGCRAELRICVFGFLSFFFCKSIGE
jgi:hypothetical protein